MVFERSALAGVPRYFAAALLFVGVYFIASQTGFLLRAQYGDVTPLWPPSGIAVALLFAGGYRWWPVVLIGEIAAALSVDQPALAGLTGGIAQLAEALIAAALLKHFAVPKRDWSLRQVCALITLGALIPPIASALLGSLGLVSLGLLQQSDLWRAALTWWVGDAVGIVILTPFILHWSKWPLTRQRQRQTWGLWTSLLAVAGLTLAFVPTNASHSLFFLLLVLVALSAANAGMTGATSAAVIMAVAVLGLNYQGAGVDVWNTAVSVAFVGASASMGYLLACALGDRRAALDALDNEKDRALAILKGMRDGVIATNAQGQVSYINDAAAASLGLRTEAAIGQDICQVLPHLAAREAGDVHPMLACMQGATQSLAEQRYIAPNGNQVWLKPALAPLRSRHGAVTGAVAVLHDLTEEIGLREALREQATHDSLTRLWNRSAFDARLRALLGEHAQGRQVALMYVDLDQFKLINDTCGHGAGDAVLKTIARNMLTALPPEVFLARLGGDEFGLLYPGAEEHQAIELAESVRACALGVRHTHDHRIFTLGASVGITFLEPSLDTTQAALARADIACYMAKERGRNQIYLYRADNADVLARQSEMQWIGHLRSALENGDFELHGQTIWGMANPSGTFHSRHVEVLLRLRQGGQLHRPESFLPAAERYGMMPTIDRWVVREVFRYLEAHPGTPTQFMINLSGATLNDPTFYDDLLRMRAEHAVDASRICLEVTERMAIHSIERSIEQLQCLRSSGFRIALDDFGAGVASFSYLKRLPLDYVKIDGSFVRNISEPSNATIVRALMEFAHLNQLECIAECVESIEVLREVMALGITLCQGYHLSYPALLRGLDEQASALLASRTAVADTRR